MHSYLKSIGFNQFTKKKEIDALIQDVIAHADKKSIMEDKDGNVFAELRKSYGGYIGIAVRGEYREDGTFDSHYYYPYFHGTGMSTQEKVDVEKHADKYSYAGVCDEIKIGVTLIFYLQNMIEYFNHEKNTKIPQQNTGATLSALSNSGMILLPVQKDEEERQSRDGWVRERNHLIEAAREGNEDAIETLTLDDMDTYSMISKRILSEDVLSIVNTYFMPYGIESDHYSILGEILDYQVVENQKTKEKIYLLNLDCNNLIFDMCINKNDLMGEPAIGRRFKGNIWMQGRVNYEV
ncbi:hypothetical protein FACS1894111_09210 [Clostridia bacterium]|nr:hypothetical protein FACS1894111_09210 [Clostridia bacterium]